MKGTGDLFSLMLTARRLGGRRKPEGRSLSATYQVVLSLEKTPDARCAERMLPPFTQSDVWMLPIQAFSIRLAISHDLISAGDPPVPIQTLSPKAAQELMAQGAQLIDIRSADEHARERIAALRQGGQAS